jgi:PAS domain S-box-containing protein
MGARLDIPPETLFEEAPCFITVQDRDLNILQANRRFRETFGDEPERKCFELYRGRNTRCNECPVLDTFASGEGFKIEKTLIAKNGRELNVIVQTTPLHDDKGEITAVMEMVTDITETKALQRKLAGKRKLLRTLFDEVPCYLSLQDREFNVLDANRHFKEEFGNFAGDKCYEVYKHRTEPCLHCPVADTFADGRSHSSEEVVTSLDGDKHNVLVQTAPIRGTGGKIESVLEISTDITEIRQLQDQLTSLGLLVGSISHSIKGMITSLDGGIYVLDSGFARDDLKRVKDGWGIVKWNVDRIRSMVLDVLYYAKDRALEPAEVEPGEMAAEVCKLQQGKAKEVGATLVCNATPTDAPFLADRASLHSMLTNLVDNSLDACRLAKAKAERLGKDGIDPRVTVDVEIDAENIVFAITDNGIGMDQETSEKAFCMFFSSKGMEGTGLGLFIASKIASKHGGNIDIDSQPGRGTTFRVILPRVRENTNDPAREPARGTARPSEGVV